MERPRRSGRPSMESSAAPFGGSKMAYHPNAQPTNSLLQAGSALLSQQRSEQHQMTPHSFQSAQMDQQSLQTLPPVWVMGKGAAPIPPATPTAPPRPFGSAASLPTVPQAMYTTFPARLKAGTTSLVQPMPLSDLYDSYGRPLDAFGTPVQDSSAPSYGGGSAAYRSARSSGRRRGANVVRYTEANESDDEFDQDTSRAGTEDEAGGHRSLKRKSPGASTPTAAEEQEPQEPRAHLGLPPPASKMIAKRVYKGTNHIYHNDDDLSKQASRNEILVPIKIDLETDQYRIKDYFTWNMNEKLVSPYHFAKLLLEDLDLPVEPFATQIQNLILQQVEEAVGVADIEMEPAAGGLWYGARISGQQGELTLPPSERLQYDAQEEAIKEARPWDWGLDRRDVAQREWRKTMADRLNNATGLGDFEDDLRVIVDYEVQILRHLLRDRMEWDLCSPLTPESFASRLCQDLGLTGEAQALISNSVREQLINHKRAALELGLVGSGRTLKEKEREIEAAWAELHAEKLERQRRRLEKGDTGASPVAHVGTTTTSNSTREPSVQPSASDNETDEAAQPDGHEPDSATDAVAAMVNSAGEEDEDDVETLHLTATATAVPTREGTSTPSSMLPATRSSTRLSNMFAPDAAAAAQPRLTPAQKLNNASYTVREILSRGPRPLDGIWRDWHESREFGPLLEKLNDEDLDKLDEANVRASRRNRREAQRTAAGGSSASHLGRRRR